MQQQPVKLCIAFVMFQAAKARPSKNSSVVFSFDCGGDNVARIEGGIATGFVIENGVVEFFLGGKMAKDHRFGNAAACAISRVVVPLKAFLGERLTATLRICKRLSSPAIGMPRASRSSLDCVHLFTQ